MAASSSLKAESYKSIRDGNPLNPNSSAAGQRPLPQEYEPSHLACTGCRSRPCNWAENNRRSEEHTSELQSRSDLVCRLLLEKKKKKPLSLSRRNLRTGSARPRSSDDC